MEKAKPFYITTTLPYVNAEPHIGFAMEIIRADAIARYKKLIGREVFFNTGTDEHGMKLWESAKKEGIEVKAYVDKYAEKFRGLVELLDISKDIHFIRTTDAHHEKSAQALWKICDERGFIYKGKYSAKYCVGCELEKTDSELDENGYCPLHPNRELELIDEENYFFALSKVAPLLKKYYGENPNLVIPDFRFNEMKAFLARGLQDFSISRSREKMPWGVPVPDDDTQVMYVWFDALTNYISTLGWNGAGENNVDENNAENKTDENYTEENNAENNYQKFWVNGEKVQYCGKDNTRQQSLTWQAMLLAAGLPGTDHIVVNGFINSGGQKMSKSLGNVISPYEVIETFRPVAGDLSSDVLRYLLLRHTNSFEDSDLTIETMTEYYNANLANGLGNLVSRTMNMAVTYGVELSEEEKKMTYYGEISNDDGAEQVSNTKTKDELLEKFEIAKRLDEVWQNLTSLDEDIQKNEPFKKIKTDPETAKQDVHRVLYHLYGLALSLEPFLPKTSALIQELIKENKKPEKPLFLRM